MIMRSSARENSKWVILVVVVLMSFMSCLDSSIVNIALPVIREGLGVGMASVEWVVTAYLMMICGLILIFGRLGDILGKSRVFQWGVALFTLGSLGCGLSRSLGQLVACRMLQGLGAAAYMANNQGIITQAFPQNERGKALGILASGVALGTMMGPPLGGLIVSHYAWSGIFWINIPLGIFAFVAGSRLLPVETARRERFDGIGATLFFSFVVLMIGGVTRAQVSGFMHPVIAGSLALSLVCLVAFFVRERTTLSPLLDLGIFRNRSFSLALICAFVSFVCINASIILLPFYFENARHFTPALAGLLMMLSPLVIAVLSPASGFMSDRVGPQWLSFAGLALMGAGFFLLALLKWDTPLLSVLCFLFVVACGQGLFQPANNTIIMSSVPREKFGVAGSVNSLVRNLGQICGVTLSTTLLYGLMSLRSGYTITDYPEGRDNLFVLSMDWIYLLLGIMAVVGTVLTFSRCMRKGKQSLAR